MNPFPGTPDASPRTQIIFSSLGRADLVQVWVTGSRSGLHTGHLVTLPAAAGVAFVPDRPFASGELVRVRAVLRSRAAGTASGDPGATALAFSFRTAVPAGADDVAVKRAVQASQPAATRQAFVSAPAVRPPAVAVSSDPDPGQGDIFLTPQGPRESGAMILSARGQLVWFLPTGREPAFNLEVEHYMGHPVLTFWKGAIVNGYGQGVDVIMDSAYRTLATIHAGNGYPTDLHEFQITPRGTALIAADVPVHADLSSVGGPTDGPVYDCVIQEIDIATRQVLWEWHSLGHIPLSESHSGIPPSGPWGYLHLNSIQELPDGNLLISGRDTWAIYKISKQTGDVMWTLGGRQSSFTMGAGTNFEFQHDARMDGDTVTLFDDAAPPRKEPQSVAKTLTVNTQTWTASLQSSFEHSPSLQSSSQGSAQLLPDGNLFVGWGNQPYFSEYTPAGRQVFDGHFPPGVTSYRAFRFQWVAQPLTRPAMAVVRSGKHAMTVYASWNGATQVARWCVLGGRLGGWLARLACVPRTGFETAIRINHRTARVAAQALDSSGRVLGTSVLHALPLGP